jgi:hypothetical protein
MLLGSHRIRLVHLTNGLFVACRRVSFGAGRMRDAHGVARFKEFQRQSRVQDYRLEKP